ncbi:myeloid differentiation primary response protein MyD88-like [Hyposmocoma kahamanoa]|uniref:myeloid differentiation primary response protein MyD88-like n=1 Tax=Hyposmocoma kahamanoa TaxID=1477025 RepID=UPI000E6D6EB5|nr:myeloid differentiation primary response protein MyD88-like [Hyposmocoma kahamanoa]
MEGSEVNFSQVQLSSLTYEAQQALSYLLDSQKLLLSEGPDKLPRDWRGLACLLNISTEITNSFESNKTAKVISYWARRADGTATVGRLLDYVQRIDRYDVFDDFMDLWSNGQLVVNQPKPFPNNIIAKREDMSVVPYDEDIEENIITFDDKIHGAPQFYHGYVLYALEDKDFVDEMLIRMKEKGYNLCTEDNLLPDYSTTFAPVSRLISSDRCRRIILVYSPDFLDSPANNFYMDYAQAVGIETRKPKILPVIYRNCPLPRQVRFYLKLYFTPSGNKASYDFWERLACSLEAREVHSPHRLNGYSSNLSSGLSITEISSGAMTGMSQTHLLRLPPAIRSASENHLNRYADYIESGNDLHTTSTIVSDTSEVKKKKKFGLKRYFLKKIKSKGDTKKGI